MIKILKYSFKNFGSFGNSETEITLDPNGQFIQIQGDNGSGKTSLIQALTYSLYGKVENKVEKDYCNIYNQNIETSVTFLNDDNDLYCIKRNKGVEIYKNKELDKRSGLKKRSIDKLIEQDIIKIPFENYNLIFSPRVDSYLSFTKANSGKRKEYLENLLHFEEIDLIYDMNKKERLNLQNKYSTLESNIENYSQDLRRLTLRIKEFGTVNSDDIDKQVKEFEEKDRLVLKKTDEKNQLLNDLKKEILNQANAIKNIQEKIKDTKDKLNNLSSNEKICPFCGNSLDEEHLKVCVNKLNSDLDSNNNEKNKIVEIVKKNKDEFNSIKEVISKLVKSHNKINFDIEQLLKQKEYSTDSGLKVLQEELKINSDKLKGLIEEKSKIFDQKTITELIETLIKDSSIGFKQKYISESLLFLNELLNEYVNYLEIDYNIKINSGDLSLKIERNNILLEEKMLSSGERNVIDFLIILSLYIFLRIKSQTEFNVLFLDEFFSTIDEKTTILISKLLVLISREMNINVFLVTHNSKLRDLIEFDKDYKVTKTDVFSDLEVYER